MSLTDLFDKRAKELYQAHIDDHPVIHCNRFPLWSELSEEQKEKWRTEAKKKET